VSDSDDFAIGLYDGYELAPDVAGDETGEELPDPVFGSLEPFVNDYLLVLYRRTASGHGRTWCAQWWRHPEAWVRLDALWRSWEYLRLDPATGISVWLRDHADPHMNVLLSAEGPLRGCKPDEHSSRALSTLPSTPIPADVEDPTRPAREGL
jgi:hypothetical protein